MAIYHLEAKIVSRGAGRSAVAAAAYLSCSRMLNEYDGVQHEYLLTQPLTKDDIRAEAARILSAFQAARGPNSPSGTHFMVQVSPDFLARANSKNQNRLVSMLPFRSLSISTLEGRKGVYALITKDEDRAQSLRLRKPSVRKKLSETKAEPGHTDKKKVREQER